MLTVSLLQGLSSARDTVTARANLALSAYGFFLALFSTPVQALVMRLLVAVLYRMLQITEGRCKTNPAELPSCRCHEICLMSLCPGLEGSPLLAVCFRGPLLPGQVCAPGSGRAELTVLRAHRQHVWLVLLYAAVCPSLPILSVCPTYLSPTSWRPLSNCPHPSLHDLLLQFTAPHIFNGLTSLL